MRILIIAFLSQILLSCIPLKVTYYEPITKNGQLRQSICYEEAGPYDKVIFDGLQGVTISLVSRLEKHRILICITITIPKDVTVTFQDNLFVINNVSTGEVISQRLSSIYPVKHPKLSCFDYTTTTTAKEIGKDIFTSLQGGYFCMSDRFCFNAPYYIYLTIDNFKPNQFTLRFPEIKINEESFQLQRILFKLKSGIFIYPLNC